MVTSGLYLAGPPFSPLYLKLGVCLSLLVEAYIFTRVYHINHEENENGDQFKKTLIFIETMGLASLLIITGGLDSPFIWYAINPILLAATLPPAYFCWIMAAAFISAAVFLQRYSLYEPVRYQPFWPNRVYNLLVFVLVTLVAQIYNFVIRYLSRQNEVMQKQLDHIKSLYEIVEVLSHRNTPQEVVNLFASYSKVLLKATKVIVCIELSPVLKKQQKQCFYAVRGPRRILSEDKWYPHLKKILANIHNQQNNQVIINYPEEEESSPGALLTVPVKSKSHTYGLISAYFEDHCEREQLSELTQTLQYLSKLCAVAMEKYSLEAVTEEMLLLEEKDRIAGEIHDGVTQNLFGLVYALDELANTDSLPESTRQQLRFLQKTAQESLKELRKTIYDLSFTKRNAEPFIDEVKKYLYDLARLNGITVNFECRGDLHLNRTTRKALYRIVREATGNAIRHGYCSNIDVLLEADEQRILLEVADNGAGFDPESARSGSENGLGLVNMKELARNIGGTLAVDSIPGRKTRVSCTIPLQNGIFPREEVAP
ncbi:MAG: sensor histidine kinase [Firmicutes bacterium]|nr:sensor histidine kinase [Bacillota bacterium]